MKSRLQMAAIGLIIGLIAVPVIGTMQGVNFAAIIVLMIAVIGFVTLVFVMIIGSEHDHYPVEAKDSAAVAAWTERLAASENTEEVTE